MVLLVLQPVAQSELEFPDILPRGSFHAEMDPRRYAAMLRVQELGEFLLKEHPEIAEMYRSRDPILTQAQIAGRVFDPIVADSPAVREKAVGYALKLLLTPDERADIARFRRAQMIEDIFEGGFEGERFREHCKNASKRRHELHGVDVAAMLRGRGRTPWSDEEKLETMRLYRLPEYQRADRKNPDVNGLHADHLKIATELNRQFHEGKEIRYPKSVRSFIGMVTSGKLEL